MSQSSVLLDHMKAGEVITPALAYELTGSYACHSRMSEIRSWGHRVECVMRRNGCRKWGEYRLVTEMVP